LGVPEKDCAQAALDELTGQTGVGIAGAVTGIVLFIAFLGTFPLCCGFNQDEDMMQDKDN
jgi:hypothetical protein